HLDFRHLLEVHDRVIGPGPRRHTRAVKAHRFLERPARRLDDPALDLVDDAVRVDDLPDVDRGERARYAHVAARTVDWDVCSDRAVAGWFLVSGDGEAAAGGPGAARIGLPARTLRRRLDCRWGGGILHVAQAVLDWVGARRGRQLVHERLERENIRVATE